MDIKNLKKYLYENPDKIQFILEELNCHHIKKHIGNENQYFTFGNPGGDNISACTVYLTESLLTLNYTREISPDKNSADFIDLVMFYRKDIEDNNFFATLKWISEKSDLDYYHNFHDEIPESLRILKVLQDMLSKVNQNEEDNIPIKPKDEVILSYYFPYVSEMFYEDGIDYGTQREFEIAYDPFTQRWTIPIRDELNNLVGVKGRYFDRIVPEEILKYYYLEQCARNKILYGYNLTKKYIDESDTVYVTESEKAVQQYWSYGIKNVIGTGGTKVSQNQIDKICRLGKKVCLSFDEDFTLEETQNLRNKFLGYIDFSAVIDKDNILKPKESPSDNKENLLRLLKNNIYQIEKTED